MKLASSIVLCWTIAGIAGLTSCLPRPTSKTVDLTITVEPTGKPGTYTVSGTATNLPERSQVVVQAIRILTPLSSDRLEPTYSILGRQTATLSQGAWKTTLTLWQTAPDGQYREAWQRTRAAETFRPTADVRFVVTADVASQPQAVQSQVAQIGPTLEGSNVRYTPDGEWYLYADEALPVSLPAGGTTPPIVTASELNGGWGDRTGPAVNTTSGKPPDLPTKQKQLDAPLSTTERVR